MFWDVAFNKSWLYVSDEIVHEQFGYKKAKDMMRHFYEKLINDFEEIEDYKEVNKEHELVKVGSRTSGSKKNAITELPGIGNWQEIAKNIILLLEKHIKHFFNQYFF